MLYLEIIWMQVLWRNAQPLVVVNLQYNQPAKLFLCNIKKDLPALLIAVPIFSLDWSVKKMYSVVTLGK